MDNYIVSARKYRPSTFHSVVGQKSLTTTLKNAIINNKLAHAYLFCGPRGVGKTTCARIFAKTINCFHPTADGEACNACESCVSFNENRSLSIYELDAASNNSVDDIRALTEQVRILPQLGEYKVYIIDEVHMLSSSAFNAFLKTLEEPPHHAIFILATTEKHKILPTILSRCQIYDFSRIGIHDIIEYLEYVATQEKVQYEKEALSVIAQKADGGMRDALSIFDQMISFSQGNLTYKSVIANLNVLDYEYYFQLLDAVLAGNVSQCLLLLNEILNKGFDGHQVITGLSVFLRDLLVCKDPQTIVLFEVGEAVREKYVQLASRCETAFLYKAIDYTNETDLSYRYSKNKRLSIELLLIRLCQINASEDSEDAKKKKIVIKPIVASQEATPAEAPATPQVVQPEKKPIAAAPVVPQPVRTVVPQPSSPESRTGGPLRISLKASKTEDAAKATENQTQVVLDTPFTQASLTEAWATYVQTITDAHFQSIAQYAKLHLGDSYVIQIKVLNPEQESLFTREAVHIITYLSEKLNNNQIKLDIKIEEAESHESLFTSKEKYKYLADKNPSLQLLVKEFNLRLD